MAGNNSYLSEAQIQFHSAEAEVSAEVVPSAASEGRTHFLGLFQLPVVTILLGLWPLLQSSKHITPIIFLSLHYLLLCPPLVRILVIPSLGPPG